MAYIEIIETRTIRMVDGKLCIFFILKKKIISVASLSDVSAYRRGPLGVTNRSVVMQEM
jgi:hypothetical protein